MWRLTWKCSRKEKAEKVKDRLKKLNKAKEKSDEKYKVFLTRQKERLENPYKLRLEKNNHVPALVIVMLVALFTGLLTPLKDIPYTYTYRTMQGNTTQPKLKQEIYSLLED